VSAIVPGKASHLLDRLMSRDKSYESVEEVRTDLLETLTRPAEVTHSRRAAHLVVQTAALWLGLMVITLVGWLCAVPGILNLWELQQSGPRILSDLQAGLTVDTATGVTGSDPMGRAIAMTQFGEDAERYAKFRSQLEQVESEFHSRTEDADILNRFAFDWLEQRSSKESGEASTDGVDTGIEDRAKAVEKWQIKLGAIPREMNEAGTAFLIMVAGFPTAWVVSALIFRGGFTYFVMGLALVRFDGRRASRLRCAWRSFLVWAPLTLLLLLAVALEIQTWQPNVSDTAKYWLHWLIEFLRWFSLGLIILYPVLALRSPGRGFHDRLAGTWLVAR
jgi:hypothetical protein